MDSFKLAAHLLYLFIGIKNLIVKSFSVRSSIENPSGLYTERKIYDSDIVPNSTLVSIELAY